MNKNYDYIFYTYLYKKINLEKYEKELNDLGIQIYDVAGSENRISKYFGFLNSGNYDNFDQNELTEFQQIFDDSLENILNNKNEVAVDFVKKTYKKYFFSNSSNEYKYYGPHNYDYLCPPDAIVISLNFIEFGDENSSITDEEKFKKELEMTRIMNDIQNNAISNFGIKVSVVKYNELLLNDQSVIL